MFLSAPTEEQLRGSLTRWRGMCTAQDRKTLLLGIKTDHNISGTHLIKHQWYRGGEVPVQSSKDTERQSINQIGNYN